MQNVKLKVDSTDCSCTEIQKGLKKECIKTHDTFCCVSVVFSHRTWEFLQDQGNIFLHFCLYPDIFLS